MATQPVLLADPTEQWTLTKVASFPRLRVLAWDNDVLYAACGYTLLRARICQGSIQWDKAGEFRPAWWRRITSFSRLTMRLCRDGFHALAISSTGILVGAVPQAIVTLAPGDMEFCVSHRVLRGTRPLHIAVTPRGGIFWGEYFDNPQRHEVHIYASSDGGAHWDVAYSFPAGTIRHVHNIVYDQWEDCLWVLTGDEGMECRILRVSLDFKSIDVVLAGKQQVRSAALITAPDAIYFSSDTPLETNHIYRLNRHGNLSEVADLSSSSICGCRVGETMFFSTMVEPSAINSGKCVCLYGSRNGEWERLLQWKKDAWPMNLFQYGNAFLPDGNNTSGYLALTTVAVENADFETSLWRIA